MAEKEDCSPFFNAIAMPVTAEEMYAFSSEKSNSYFVVDPKFTRPLNSRALRTGYTLHFTNRVAQPRKCIARKHNTALTSPCLHLTKFLLASSCPFKYLTSQLVNMN